MSGLTTHTIGIIMNGVTGRMGTNQHLMRSIVAIREQGGIKISDNEVIMPDPLLVGRNPVKLKDLSATSGIEHWTTDLTEALADSRYSIYFDAQTTTRRVESVTQAIEAGKHIYCEKPTALTTDEAYNLYVQAQAAGVKHGVVQDKLWLPGLIKLKSVIETGLLGDIFSVRGEFGYWVFEGDIVPSQRPSWNYRKEDGGGLLFDMLPHWRYILDNIFGETQAVTCLSATHIKERWDEQGKPYDCTADDAAYTTFQLAGGIVAHINSSWCVRVRRDDLVTFQVDGTRGTAIAGTRKCFIQPYSGTPRPVWNPDIDSPINHFDHWQEVPAQKEYENAFKIQWELFLRHVVKDEPFRWNLLEGAKGVQLAEVCQNSWDEKRWLDIPTLNA
jgi:predicted dehydrogenase